MYKKEPIMPLMITHRMRGFDKVESSIHGLKNALGSPFQGAEFDTRFSSDRRIFVNHDPDLVRFNGQRLLISSCTSDQLTSLKHPSTEKSIPSLREMLEIAATHKRTDFHICIDIKEHGQEQQIVTAIQEFGLADRVIIFSWVPEALMTLHSLLPHVPLFFSYYPVSGWIKLLAMKARVQFTKIAGSLLRKPNKYSQVKPRFQQPGLPSHSDPDATIGFETEYYCTRLPEGMLSEALRNSGGGVCADYRLIDEAYSIACKQEGFRLCIYGVKDNSVIKKIGSMQPDIILTDDPDLTK